MRTAAFGRTAGGKRQRFDDDDDAPAPTKFTSRAPASAAPAAAAPPLEHPSDASHSYRVQTTTNADGSEIPSRLNNKVFIDGLPFNHDPAKHDHKTLEELMAQYLNDWKVGKMMHMNKKPGQGFAYVAFRSPNSVEVAVNVLNGRKFLGRPLRVELPRTAKAPSAFQEKHNDINSTVDRQVLITDLAKIAEPEIIRQVLRDVAPQLEAKVEAIKVTSNNRKAFLTIASPEDVDFAVKFLDGYQLLGRTIGATRAMAPGSLPYSKRAPVSAPTTAATGAATGYGDGYDAAPSAYGKAASSYDDDEDAMPLGVASSAPAAKKAAPTPAPAPAAAKAVTKADLGKREVFVGGISEDTTEGMLRQHFANCGIIRSVKVVTNPHTHQSSGVAVVTFAMPSSGEFAIRNLNGSLLNGNLIRVDREDGEAVDSDKILGVGKSAPAGAKRTDGQREEKVEEEIDTDAFFKARGIKNPAAYFASVPKIEKKEEPARKEKKARTEEPAKKVVAAEPVVAKKAEKPAAVVEPVKKAADEKKKTAVVAEKPALSRKEKEEKAKKAAPTPTPVPKNVVSFDYDDVDEVNARPTGGDDSDDEERFVDVDAKKAVKKGGKKGKK